MEPSRDDGADNEDNVALLSDVRVQDKLSGTIWGGHGIELRSKATLEEPILPFSKLFLVVNLHPHFLELGD